MRQHSVRKILTLFSISLSFSLLALAQQEDLEIPNINSISDAEAFFKGQQAQLDKTRKIQAEILAKKATKPAAYTHSVAVEVIPFKTGLWTADQIKIEKTQAQRIYNQCDVRLDFKDLSAAQTSPQLYFDIEGYDDADDKLPAESALLAGKANGTAEALRVFFIDSFDPEYASISATSMPDLRRKQKDQDAVAHAVWMTHQIASGEMLNLQMAQMSGGYNVLAHELGHVLMNVDHITDPRAVNLMHGKTENLSDFLEEDQCRAIRNSKLTKKISSGDLK